MAKKEPQITVTMVFDGGLQAKDIFADLIIEKFLQNRPEKPLPKREKPCIMNIAFRRIRVRLDCAVKTDDVRNDDKQPFSCWNGFI